jgi:Zn-finger nucleic acid-binding protein
VDCPRCSEAMEERPVGTARAAVCGGCRGVWVRFASIEAVMPRLRDLAPGPQVVVAPCAGDAKLNCPECGGDLVAVKSGEFGGVAVRTCLVCFGRWVDGAELNRFGRRGFLARLLGWLMPGRGEAPPAGSGPGAAPQGPEESVRTEASSGEDNRD